MAAADCDDRRKPDSRKRSRDGDFLSDADPKRPTTFLTSLLGMSKTTSSTAFWNSWAFASEAETDSTRSMFWGSAAVEALHRLQDLKVSTFVRCRRELYSSDVPRASSLAASLAGPCLVACVAMAVPSTAVRAALGFAAGANALCTAVRAAVAWHHLVILEGPYASVAVELLERGICVRAIESPHARDNGDVLRHRRQLMLHRFDNAQSTDGEVLDAFSVGEAATVLTASKVVAFYHKRHAYDLLHFNCQHFADELLAAYRGHG